jgi:hypothetical protein
VPTEMVERLSLFVLYLKAPVNCRGYLVPTEMVELLYELERTGKVAFLHNSGLSLRILLEVQNEISESIS